MSPSTPSFNLHALGWKAFEDLCTVVCHVVFEQIIERFLPSNDAGRDAAFLGAWRPTGEATLSGRFVIQCKHSSSPGKHLTPSSVKPETDKAKELAADGLCDHYILMTNMGVTGRSAGAIEKQLRRIPGIESVRILGRDWIETAIRDEPRLRMQVPRLYGLGDLTQILDERSYRQARSILETYRQEFATFVPTKAFHDSVRAIVAHSFVLLLGAPAAGKSVIAASLALGAIDRWGCNPIKVADPRDFLNHWNPDEPTQFFWIDDAFGSNQCDEDLIRSWNQQLPHLRAAVAGGARVIFTSRDYIFRTALGRLRTRAFPLLNDSKVVIEVEKLSLEEKQRILYNHVKLGDQGKATKTSLKRYLASIAKLPSFSPESARRLASRSFFSPSYICRELLCSMFNKPLDHLYEVIREMDNECRSALALLFMEGGALAIPIDLTESSRAAIERLGGTPSGTREAFLAMRDTFTRISVTDEGQFWTFKHPTISDAFAQYVADDPDLIDIYLLGAGAKRIVREVVCGVVSIEGARVRVPLSRVDVLVDRLKELESRDIQWGTPQQRLASFVASRCDDEFVREITKRMPCLIRGLSANRLVPLSINGHANLLGRLHAIGELPDEARNDLLERIREVAVDTPDASFLRNKTIVNVLTRGELTEILESVRARLTEDAHDLVYEWSQVGDDADERYAALGDAKSCLDDYRKSAADAGIDMESAVREVTRLIESTMEDMTGYDEGHNREEDYDRSGRDRFSEAFERSIFDDVDK